MNPPILFRENAMLTSFAVVAVLGLGSFQDPPAEGQEPPAAEPTQTSSASAEALRSRIHDMRMSLLLGGEKVREAEDQASTFYGGKVDMVDQRLDTVSAELTEKRASYDLKLQNALSSSSPEERRRIMQEASALRSEITELESENGDLENKRGKLNQLIVAIDDRDRERQKLAAKIETSDSLEFDFGLPLASVGLAPDLPSAPPTSPLANTELVQDLLEVDPRGGRQVLFEMDPVGYWDLFPLRPPSGGVVSAFGFPLPDLEGSR
jgi:hypothetical protein